MKIILLFIISTMSFSLLAQNYQTIKSTDINYFGSASMNYILATRTDSIELSGTDSVFYSYKTLREPDASTTEACEFFAGPNWYGSKVVILANGDNLFFNKDLDTIRIETQAVLNDTFLVYTHPGGSIIQGVVSSVNELSVLGTLDSVKTITLISDTAMAFTNPTILLGKNHGFVSFFPPYSFPFVYLGPAATSVNSSSTYPYDLIGMENPYVGVTRLKNVDIYDFDIGDRFIYSTYTSSLGQSPWSSYYGERDVISKTLYLVDSVDYQFHDTSKVIYGDGSGTVNVGYQGGMIPATYYNLDEYYFNRLPEELEDFIGDNWNYLFINSCGSVEQTDYREAFYYADPGNSACINFADLSWYATSQRIIAGGGVYPVQGMADPGYSVYTSFNLSYFYKINGSECGSNTYLGTKGVNFSEKDYLLYPNPAVNAVSILFNGQNQNQMNLQIIDFSGKVVYSEGVDAEALSSGYSIDISEFENGMYLVFINDGVNTYQQKLIKN
jgi:hypothetical protein